MTTVLLATLIPVAYVALGLATARYLYARWRIDRVERLADGSGHTQVIYHSPTCSGCLDPLDDLARWAFLAGLVWPPMVVVCGGMAIITGSPRKAPSEITAERQALDAAAERLRLENARRLGELEREVYGE